MVKKLLIPVMVLAVCAAAQGQHSVSSTVSSRSYNGSLSRPHTSSSGSSQHTASYSSSARYTPASEDHSVSGYRSFSSSTPGSSGSSAFRRDVYSGDRTRQEAYLLPNLGGHVASFGDVVVAPAQSGHVLMDDKYALAPIPKTVPTANVHTQRGTSTAYGGGSGLGGGLQVNPFYTPGFSSCNTADDSHDYQIQFQNFVQGRSLYGLPWYSWVGRRYIYWNYWRSGLSSLCQESLQLDLARAKTPAEMVEVMRSYQRCLRTINGDPYYDRLYPSTGGWGW